MKKTVFALVATFLFTVSAEVIYKNDLSEKTKDMKLSSSQIEFKDGSMLLPGSRVSGNIPSVTFESNTGDRAYGIKFNLRLLGHKLKDDKPVPGHYGALLHFADGGVLRIYNMDGWVPAYTKPDKTPYRYPRTMPRREDEVGKEITVEIAFEKSGWFFRAGGMQSPLYDVPSFSPLQSVNIYGYNRDVAVSGLEITTLEAQSEAAPTEKKTLLSLNKQIGKGLDATNGTLRIDLPGKLDSEGTIMVWYKSGKSTFGGIMRGYRAEDKKPVLGTILNALGLQIDFGCGNEVKPQSAYYVNSKAISPDEWHFHAISFRGDGFVNVMSDSMSYSDFGHVHRAWSSRIIPGLDMKGMNRIDLVKGREYDMLEVRNYFMTEAELVSEYRKVIPVDIKMDSIVLEADRKTVPVFRIAPGNTFMAPRPYLAPLVNAKVKVGAEVFSAKGDLIASQEYALDVDKTLECKLPEISLGHMESASVRFGVDGVPFMTYPLSGWRDASAAKPSDEPWKNGKLVFEKQLFPLKDVIINGKVRDCGKWQELGSNKYDSLAFEVDFTESGNGKPFMIEIDWPDDKPRNIGLYMYRPTPNGKTRHLRDALAGGIAAGNEYPSSGKVLTARYFFFPLETKYLFECRTLSSGYPAAIAGFRVYSLEGEMPKLKINHPIGLPHRMLGHLDEDQTFDFQLITDFSASDPFKIEKVTEKLLDYYDYTGQEIFAYPLLRYGWPIYPLLGSDFLLGMYPYRPENVPYILRALGKRGASMRLIINLDRMPEFKRHDWRKKEWTEMGWVRLNPFGEIAGLALEHSANLLVPEVEKMFFDHIGQVLRQNAGSSSFQGVDYWLSGMIGANNKASSIPAKYFERFKDKGLFSYDDYSINLFRREAMPEMPDFKDSDRFMKRFEYLLEPEREKAWEKWNLEKIAAHIGRLRTLIDTYDPKLELSVSPGGLWPEAKYISESENTLRVSVGEKRFPTHFRWDLQFGNKITDRDLKNYPGMEKASYLPVVSSFYSYNETFRESPSPQYGSYFQNCDLKPHGRFFLKEPAYVLAAHDMLRFMWGGQPLTAWGREEETREFAKAFCALPALPFNTLAGSGDPVTVRYLETKNGTYVYCVNIAFMDLAVNLKGVTSLTDLSTGKVLNGSRVELKPYQLRSFLLEKGKPESAHPEIPAEFKAFYASELKKAEDTINLAQGFKIDTTEAEAMLNQAKKAFNAGKYAECHTYLYSPAWHRLKLVSANTADLKALKELLGRNTLRVNCGSKSFLKLPDGRLFAPDAEFSEGYGYGFTGPQWMMCDRATDGIKPISEAEVFKTELYNIDSYKVKLANGKYRVRLYIKWGFAPSFTNKNRAPDLSQTLEIGGEKHKIDYRKEMKEDMNNPILCEFRSVAVTNGLLEIRFTDGGGKRLLNALEIEPEVEL